MDRKSVINLMKGYGAKLIPMCGDRRYHRGYQKKCGLENPIGIYNEKSNLGMELGRRSIELAGIIIDHHTSPRAADFFLPKTDLVFGRPSRPKNHRIYRCHDVGLTHKFKHGGMQSVELRGKWSNFMMLPSSEHVSGEMLEFSNTGSPAVVSYEELYKSALTLNMVSIDRPYYRNNPEEYIEMFIAKMIAANRCQKEIAKDVAALESYFAIGDPYWNMEPRQIDDQLVNFAA